MLRKYLIPLMALLMVAAMLVGCGGGGSATTPPASDTGTADTGSTGGDTGDTGSTDDGGSDDTSGGDPTAPDISKEVSLVMYLLGDVPSDLDRVYEQFNPILKERINATLKTNYLSWGDWQTKYSLILAAGEGVDLMYTSDWAYYTTESAKGAFLELTDEFMNTYMPMTLASQDPASLKQATIGGKLYAIPKNTAGLEGENWVMIRKDLREKYGMAEITSIEQLEEFYIAVLENESGVLPFAASADGGFNSTAWRQPNQLYYLTNIDWCYQISGTETKAPADFSEITYAWFRDDAIPYYELMKKWSDLGFWSKNAINNTEQVRDAFENGKSASLTWNMTIFLAGKNLRDNNAEWDFEALDINPGTARKQALYTNDAIAIASTSENPERAAMFIDLVKNDLEVYMALNGGIEDVHYVINADGTRGLGPEADKYPWAPSTWCFNLARGVAPDNADILDEEVVFTEEQEKLIVAPDMAAFRFDVEPVKNELAAVNALKDEFSPMLQLGMVEDIAATVADWQSKAEAAGLAKIEEEMKKQYEEWYASMY